MSHTIHAVARPFFGKLDLRHKLWLLRLLRLVERAIVVAVAGLCLVIVVQLAYPRDRVRPFLTIGSLSVGLKSQEELSSTFTQLNNQVLNIQAASRTYKITPKNIGITLNASVAARQLTNYPWLQRVIPFTLFSRQLTGNVATQTNSSKLHQFVKQLASDNNKPATNASAAHSAKGGFVLKPASSGVDFNAQDVSEAVSIFPKLPTNRVIITGSVVKPDVTNDMVESAISRVMAAAQKPPVISYDGSTYAVPKDEMLGWAQIDIDAKNHKVTVSYDRQALRAWINQTLPLVLVAPQTTVITTMNGVETGRTSAANGQGLDVDKTTDTLLAALQTGQQKVTASLMTLTPEEELARRYTPTSAGLQALITDWEHDYPGMTASVTLQELGGQGRHADLNGSRTFGSASIYKLYVSWYVMHQIEQGKIDPGSEARSGKTVAQCIEAMIVVSDNACGVALGDKYGWDTIENFVVAGGFAGTAVNKSPTWSTTNDTARYLEKLNAGQLMNSSDTNTLLGYMGRQIYRSAIPAGSPGSTVQDKVGFLDSIWDDAAIVRGHASTYVLVVFTDHGGPSAIKDLAQRIQTLIQS